MKEENPVGLQGIAFVEFAGPDPDRLERLFLDFGFSRLKRHRSQDVVYFRQHGIHFLLNRQPGSFGQRFAEAHGPCICSMGWRVDDADWAVQEAVRRGARPYEGEHPYGVPAIYGIGDSLIHFVDGPDDSSYLEHFVDHEQPLRVEDKGFLLIDHLTNNVQQGTMSNWARFYKEIFGFSEVRYFDIKGKKTGLTSYALRAPGGAFSIPINEASDEKSQIAEYLEQYRGPGVQHLAFLSQDLLASLDKLAGSGIETLDIDDEYYEEVFDRVPGVTEDPARIKDHRVLVDGDEEGYLLQIFTKNVVGPIFIEMIQRKNHLAFGEGNFSALFRSIERDQERRGVL